MTSAPEPSIRRRPPIRGPVGAIASRAYGFEIGRRNRRFDAGIGVTRLDRTVISIGNLSVGGTGKTPMVRWVVGALLAAGRTPCIAMRGYGKRGSGESDEEGEYRRGLRGVAVVAQADRIAGLRRLFATEEGRAIDAVVLDDGFQHRRLARDLDLVLVDASRPLMGERLLPAGWLRESVKSLRRADGVIITHAERASPGALEALKREIEAAHGRGPVAVTAHEWSGLVVASGGREEVEGTEWLASKRVLAVCAIGNPEAFLAEAKQRCGGVEAFTLRDHARYTPVVLNRLFNAVGESGAEAILTTEKDWSKLRLVPSEQWPCPVARAQLSLRFREGELELQRRLIEARPAKV